MEENRLFHRNQSGEKSTSIFLPKLSSVTFIFYDIRDISLSFFLLVDVCIAMMRREHNNKHQYRAWNVHYQDDGNSDIWNGSRQKRKNRQTLLFLRGLRRRGEKPQRFSLYRDAKDKRHFCPLEWRIS